MIQEQNIQQFKNQASKFTNPVNVKFDRVIRPRVLVIGDDGVGKTTLSRSIAVEMDCVYVNAYEVLEAVVKSNDQEHDQVISYMDFNGSFVKD